MTDVAAPHYAPLLALEPDAVRCPYPYFEKLRAESPVTWIEELGCFAVTRYTDVLEVVRNHELFSSAMPTGPKVMADMLPLLQQLIMESEELRPLVEKGFAISAANVLLNADPPVHDRQRGLVNRAFTPRKVRQLEPAIRDIADRLIDGFVDKGGCEFVSEFAVGLPLTVIATELGVEDGDLPSFKRWSDAFVAVIGNHHLTKDDLAELVQGQAAFLAYFTEKIEERRADPRDDLISDVVHASIEGAEPLSTIEMLAMFSQFLVAGNETTTKLLASTMLLLLQHPAVMARVRADRSLIPGMIEESLRLEAPVQGLFRVARRDTEIAGVPIPAGSSVWVVYASANRDRDEFETGDGFDPEQSTARHLSFGQGVHFCLGAALSRAEARIAFEALFDRLDDIRLAAGNTFTYEPSYALHGLKELRLTFAPAPHS